VEIATGDVSAFDLAPDGSRWAYAAAPFGGPRDVFVTRYATSYGALQISPPLGLARGARAVEWSSDGSLVLYTLDLAGFDVVELFATAPGSATVTLSGPLVPGGQVTSFAAR
jgi:hypothetical protein